MEKRIPYPVERRRIRGTDLYSDISVLSEDVFRDSKNLTIEGGVVKNRPGSTRYGSCTFAGLGTIHGLFCLSTTQGEWVLAHCGAKIYKALKTGGTGTAIQDLASADLVVADADHPSREPFIPFGMEYDSSGNRIFKILFRNKAGCKILEYRESAGTWVGRSPSISSGASYFSLSYAPYLSLNQAIGTYRVRLKPSRAPDGTGGVITTEGPSFARDSSGNDRPFQEVTIPVTGQTITLSLTEDATATLIASGTNGWIVEATRNLEFAAGTSFSINGNDPNLYYEVAQLQLMGPGPTTWYIGFNVNEVAKVKPNTFNFQSIPGHELSSFSSGILFFAAKSSVQSRIFAAGADGFATHAEMYDPALFVSADEADSKAITHLEIIGNDLGVWKETKTGILPNRDMESEIVWRDKKIGAPAQGCVSMLTERQSVVLCHDGQVRIFDGTGYDHSLDLADARLAPISEPVRTVTEALVPVGSAVIAFVWHREKLHLLYSSGGVRKGLQLLPRYGYGWMPWEFSEDSHLMNAMAEGDTKWVFIHSDGTVWEQSPLAGATLDRDSYALSWLFREVIFPQNRRSLLRLEGCFIEGIFDVLTQASLVLNEAEVTTAAVGVVPDSGVPKTLYARWFRLASATEIRARCVEVILEGTGAMTRRALAVDALEEPYIGVPGTPAAQEGVFAYLPTYTARMVAYIRFDSAASTTQRDFSGYARNLTWQDGTYTTLADMAPYGGTQAEAGANDGFLASSWDGMDYLGDDAGANSVPQTWEIVLYRADSGAAYLERAYRDATGEAWEITVQADGALRFDLYTDARKWRWTTASGIIPAFGAYTAPCVIQVVLYDTGNQLRLWCGPAASALAEVAVTRAALGAASAWTGNWNIGYQSAIGISHFRRLVRLREEPEARAFHNLIRSLM